MGDRGTGVLSRVTIPPSPCHATPIPLTLIHTCEVLFLYLDVPGTTFVDKGTRRYDELRLEDLEHR